MNKVISELIRSHQGLAVQLQDSLFKLSSSQLQVTLNKESSVSAIVPPKAQTLIDMVDLFYEKGLIERFALKATLTIFDMLLAFAFSSLETDIDEA